MGVCSLRLAGLLVVALCGLQNVRPCRTYHCPHICSCSQDTFQCTRDTQQASQLQAPRRLILDFLPFQVVPTHAFKELVSINAIEITMSSSITRIQQKAFVSIHSLQEIIVQNMNSLQVIEKGAFTDLPRLQYLSICNTGLTHFPDFSTISSLVPSIIIDMTNNMGIHSIPANSFQGMTIAFVTMNLLRNGFKEIQSHAFNETMLNSLVLKDNRFLTCIQDDAFKGALGPRSLDISSTALRSLPTKGLEQMSLLRAESTVALKSLPPLKGLTELVTAKFTYPSHCCAFNTWNQREREYPNRTFCDIIQSKTDPGNPLDIIRFDYLDLCPKDPSITCSPQPDAFNPCEDLLGYPALRYLAWIISISAICGNLAVLLTLLIGYKKLTVSKYLICNLAFADLCMGLYQLFIAAMDYSSCHEYYNHAIDWQLGPGCASAGFLTMFSRGLSVYTLTVISVERRHTIVNAMHVDKRLRIRHLAVYMAFGWVFSLLVALLPLLGVSSYSKVSICLPMDIETASAQMYVVAVLVLNIVAFVVICYCYACIYLSVRNPELPSAHRGDTKIAKRMALLIFTDFLCVAPISFFAITAALGMPLITVTHSKILLILFYPLNSVCNPFLYTIFTRSFRKDMSLLLGRCGWRRRAGSGLCRSHTGLSATQRLPTISPLP